MKRLLWIAALSVAGLLSGCSSNSSSPTLTSIQVTPATQSIVAGLTQQFKATGTYSNNSTQDLTATATWSSSNSAVATIAAGGLATGKAAGGPVTISAMQNGVTGTANLQVTAATLTSIAVTPANETVPVGTMQQFTAMGTYSDGSTQNLTTTATWSSTTPAVASIVINSGLATAASIGGTTIAAASGTVSGSTQLTVAAATLVSLQISDGDVTIAEGTTHQYTAVGIYNDGSRHSLTNQVTWGSSQTGVATITGLGRASGLTQGTSSITASLGSVNAPAVTLSVTNATLTAITVAPSTRTIAPLTQQAFTAIGTFSDASTQNITQDATWASSQQGVATISNTAGSIGFAVGVGQGTTSISASLLGATGSAPLDVSGGTLTSITLTPSTAGMATGSTLAMNAVANFSDGTQQPINTIATWQSSAPNVATVSNIGSVTGLTNGPVTISAQLGNVSQNASLTVESVTGLAVSPASASFAAGTSAQLTATGTLTDGSTQNLTGTVIWTSSDPSAVIMSVASGSKGLAVGEGSGSSVASAAFAGFVATSQLTVTSATLSTITVTPANPNIALGSSQQFKAEGTFSDNSTQDLTQQVTWSSSDINVAILDASGAATTTGTGTTTVSAVLSGVQGTTVLTVH